MKSLPFVAAITTLLLMGAGCGTQQMSPTDSATTTSATTTVQVPPNTLIVPNATQPETEQDGKG
jgi:PBP1b-binding outer membrane lipoprotein LpoB